MDDLFKRTLRDINLYSKPIKALSKSAIDLGLDPKDVNVPRVFLKVEATIRTFLEDKKLAEDLGYTSVKVALKALKQRKENPDFDITRLPEVFHKVPKIWLDGKSPNRVHPGFAPLNLRQALRAHKFLIPELICAWDLTDGDEELQAQIFNSYLSTNAEEFEKYVHDFIYDLDEIPLEEQLAERTAIRQAELIDLDNSIALGRFKK